MARAVTTVSEEIRDVTDEEVAHYTEQGWVFLPGLFSPALSAELRRAAEDLVEPIPGDPLFKSKRPVGRDGIEPFRQVAWSEQIGRVAHRLINRSRLTDEEIPTRYLDDLIWCRDPGVSPIQYHQDSITQGADRVGRLNFWVALEEVTPEMGAMRFLSGSHREGPLGSAELEPGVSWADERYSLLARYPKLAELYELSPPLHYQPGDATVHHGWLVHGSPANESDRQRWCYILEYAPADVRHRKGMYGVYDDESLESRLGTTAMDAALWPVVYPSSP
jgi:hypothetical protein